MLNFLSIRLLRMVSVLAGVALVVLVLLHLIPGTPWNNYASTQPALNLVFMDQATEDDLSRRFGLDMPLWRQFTRYLVGDYYGDGGFTCGVICGNLGPSISQRGRSVQHILFAPPENQSAWNSRFGYSLRLVLLSALIAVGLGVLLGIASTVKNGSALERAISFGLTMLLSIPNFVLGLIVIIVLASWLKIIKVLPDWDNPVNWIVPAFVLAIVPMAGIARVTRTSLLHVIGEDYIRTARAKGLTEKRVMRIHVLRPALAPIITYSGPVIVEMLAGLLIVENLFSFPGFGREYWQAVLKLDYPMILGLTLIYATGIVLVNMLVDFACDILDPRLREAARRSVST